MSTAGASGEVIAQAPTAPTSMGLKGIWAQFANITAILLICVMFYQDRHAALDAAKEDRSMYREEMVRHHDEAKRQGDALLSLTETVRMLHEDVKKLHRKSTP